MSLIAIAIGIGDQGSGIGAAFKVLDPRSPIPDPLTIDPRSPIADPSTIEIRTAAADEAGSICELIDDHLAEGHLLPRHIEEVVARIDRFVVAICDEEVVGCAELAPLGHAVAEVRSLVVARRARGCAVGQRIIAELLRRATAAGFEKLCAFTHSPSYFVHLGFSMVPHAWVPEKIATDCHSCSQFRRCGQYAAVRPLTHTRHGDLPVVALHG